MPPVGNIEADARSLGETAMKTAVMFLALFVPSFLVAIYMQLDDLHTEQQRTNELLERLSRLGLPSKPDPGQRRQHLDV